MLYVFMLCAIYELHIISTNELYSVTSRYVGACSVIELSTSVWGVGRNEGSYHLAIGLCRLILVTDDVKGQS